MFWPLWKFLDYFGCLHFLCPFITLSQQHEVLTVSSWYSDLCIPLLCMWQTNFPCVIIMSINLFAALCLKVTRDAWTCSYQTPLFWAAQVDQLGELLYLAAEMHLLEVILIPIALVLRMQVLEQLTEFQVGKEVHLLDLQTPSARHLQDTPLT